MDPFGSIGYPKIIVSGFNVTENMTGVILHMKLSGFDFVTGATE